MGEHRTAQFCPRCGARLDARGAQAIERCERCGRDFSTGQREAVGILPAALAAIESELAELRRQLEQRMAAKSLSQQQRGAGVWRRRRWLAAAGIAGALIFLAVVLRRGEALAVGIAGVTAMLLLYAYRLLQFRPPGLETSMEQETVRLNARIRELSERLRRLKEGSL